MNPISTSTRPVARRSPSALQRPFILFLLALFKIHLLATEPWTLERAIPFALDNSPDARVAQHRIAAARAGLDQARSGFWPQLQARSSYIRTDNPMQVFGAALNQQAVSPSLDFNNVPDADNLNVHGLLTLPLYTGGRISSAQQSARAQTDAARHQAEAIRTTLAFEVARAFYTVQQTRQFIHATRAATEAFESNLNIVTRRFENGTALRHEVLDIQVRLAQAREDLARARNAHALALRAFRNLLGLDSPDIAVSDTVTSLELPPPNLPAHRMELLAARRQTQAAEAELRRSRGGRLPEISAFGRYDYDHGWKFNGSGDSYTVGLQAQWDLWDGQRTRARIHEARAHLDTARELERRLLLALDLELERARLNLDEANERLAVSEQAVQHASESATLTRARFEQGLALTSQLIDTESALTATRVRRAEAEADQQIAIAALRKALGLRPLHNPEP
jgi:outer membrane protein TolC